MTNWIRVEDKLPENGTTVIGFFPDGCETGEKVNTAIRYGDRLISDFPNSTAAFFKSSHWMPLPEPPTV